MRIQSTFSFSQEDNLLRKFEEIHDFIYSNDGLSPQQTLEEFIKILFVKIYDENERLHLFSISKDEWDNTKSGKLISTFTQRIDDLFEKTKQAYKDIFDADDRIRITTIALGFTINKLQNIALLNSAQDVKGLAFQKFLSHHEKDRNGQFFTPEPVIDFCTEILQPKFNETIIDPACGSGGFLMSVLKYVQTNCKNFSGNKFISKNIYGLEINKSIARIARMKLLLEANSKINIYCTNALEDLDSLKLSISFSNGFDLILTNPPFGAKITNASTLSKFDLGYKWKFINNEFHKTKTLHTNQNVEILFIERCLQLLKEGGKVGIVLPNGSLENPSLEYLRYYIKSKAKILAIIRLPQETFIPFGTGVKTSLLFLKKHTSNKVNQYPIFFGKISKLGYQGNKSGTPIYKKDQHGKIMKDNLGKLIIDEDFSVVLKSYKTFQKDSKIENENTFCITNEELNGRFDYDFHSPENRNILAILDKQSSVRLSDVCDIVKNKSDKIKDKNAIVEYVELSDINTNSYEIINSNTYKVHELPSRASYEIQEGDIITGIAGNSVGTRKHATALVTKEYEGSICTNGFRILRNFKIDIYYILYFLKSDLFLKQMFMYRTGAAIPSVADTDLANVLIYLPNDKKIKDISKKMKRAIELRQESRVIIDGIYEKQLQNH